MPSSFPSLPLIQQRRVLRLALLFLPEKRVAIFGDANVVDKLGDCVIERVYHSIEVL